MSEIQMLSVVWYGLPAGWLGQGQVVVVVCLALATDNDTSTQSIHLTRVLGGAPAMSPYPLCLPTMGE